jgi:DUF971 family protein
MSEDAQAPYADLTPDRLAWTSEGHMDITWSDGHRSIFTPEHLRAICPCAECMGTHGTPPKAFNILTDRQVQGAAVKTVIRAVTPVGHYAIAFTWGDGHDDGIYTWSYLRSEPKP